MKDSIIKQILQNSAICLNCNEEIVSKFTHDYVTCKCGELSVDGGNSYLKRNFTKINSHRDTSIYDVGDHLERRKYLKWGNNYDENMNRLPETNWLAIQDMNTGHIQAILNGNYTNNPLYLETFKNELEYRKENNL